MLQHKGTNSIETLRLILRRFEEWDAKDMYYNWASDAEVVRFLPWGPHTSISVSERRIIDWINRYHYPNYYNWALYLKRTRQVIGSISVEIQNDQERTCEIGYCISREYWGQGIMTEALRTVMHYLFYEIGYQRIKARHDTLNIASGRVMQKAGMHLEKTINQANRRRDGSFYDCAVYGKSIDEE